MFEGLSDRLGAVLKDLRGHGKLTEANVEAGIRQVRLALLEADVTYLVVKDFISGVKKKALGAEVLRSITPGQQFTKIVRDELTAILGGQSSELTLEGNPPVVLVVGLQGSGKTTSVAKLARLLKAGGRNPFIVAADLVRPAAVLQLKRLSEDIGVECFAPAGGGEGAGGAGEAGGPGGAGGGGPGGAGEAGGPGGAGGGGQTPLELCRAALGAARSGGYDTVLVDTAGRLHIDAALMEELAALKAELNPSEVLLVADAMTGQDAVTTARSFDVEVGITGIVLTKLDGDARGGAALSMRTSTGKPVKFAGIGEKLDGLEVFHPERLAGRILGMGDVVTLVEKAHEAIDEKKAKELERKIRKDAFTLQDFLDQLRQIKKLGSLDGLLSMLPGFNELKKTKGLKVDERELDRVEAIINSMTSEERLRPSVLNARRRIRIARGSGTRVEDVNKLIKQYAKMRQMMKKMKKAGGINPMGLFGP